MTKYTDVDVLKGFEEQYCSILNNTDDNLNEYNNEINAINFQLLHLAETKQHVLEEKQNYIRDRWYRYRLHKRILDKFKIKNIYQSKKAHEYYLKYVNKRFKFPKTSLDFNLDQFKDMLELGAKKNLFGDQKKREAYLTVLQDLFGKDGQSIEFFEGKEYF